MTSKEKLDIDIKKINFKSIKNKEDYMKGLIVLAVIIIIFFWWLLLLKIFVLSMMAGAIPFIIYFILNSTSVKERHNNYNLKRHKVWVANIHTPSYLFII